MRLNLGDRVRVVSGLLLGHSGRVVKLPDAEDERLWVQGTDGPCMTYAVPAGIVEPEQTLRKPVEILQERLYRVLCDELSGFGSRTTLGPSHVSLLAGRAVEATGLDDFEQCVERAVRAFAIKEAENNGWIHTYEGEAFEKLISERGDLWRSEIGAALHAFLGL